MTFRILIVGAGRIANVHAISVGANRRLKLAGFVDPAGGGKLAAEWSVPNYMDLESAVKTERPDALVIASPTATHVGYLLQAASLGLPTLCEKPVAFEREPVVQAIEATNNAGIPVILGFHRRFDVHRRELRDRVRSGEIGKVEHVLQLSRDPRLAARTEIAHQGSIIDDMGVHDLDELLWIVGSLPDAASGWLDCNVDPALSEIGAYDTGNLLLAWRGGPVAHVSLTRRAVHAFEQRLEVFGSEGRLICGDPLVNTVVFDGPNDTRYSRRHDHFWDRYRPAYQAEIDHLADILAKGERPYATLEDGLRVYDFCKMVDSGLRQHPNSQ